MKSYTEIFLQLVVRNNALLLLEQELTSGRRAPYKLNIGAINSGVDMMRLAGTFTAAILENGEKPDVIFAPPMKGLFFGGLVVGALALSGWDVKFSSCRAEEKKHGEGGRIIGAEPTGSVMFLDDALTTGTTVLEYLPFIQSFGGEVQWFTVGLNRMERTEDAPGSPSAREKLAHSGIKLIEVATAVELLGFLRRTSGYEEHIRVIEGHLASYGAAR